MKILVLIIADDSLPIYREFKRIWRAYMKAKPNNVSCFFIQGNPDLPSEWQVDDDTIMTKCKESLVPGCLEKTLLSFGFLFDQECNYEYRQLLPWLTTTKRLSPTFSFALSYLIDGP